MIKTLTTAYFINSSDYAHLTRHVILN